MPTSNITLIIRKIFDDYDEKNGAQQKTDYTQRAQKIVQTWTQSMAKEGLTTKLICELHRLVCEDEWIPINDPKGGISGFAKAGEYRNIHLSAVSILHKNKLGLFLSPEQISKKMENLVFTMYSIFFSQHSKAAIIENIVSFIVELLIIHPFGNQNGRIAQILMELLAFQANIEQFHISFIIKNHSEKMKLAIEKVIDLQNVKPFMNILEKFKEESLIDYYQYLQDNQ